MRIALTLAAIALSVLSNAHAADYELKPGDWRLYEGIGIDQRTAGQSSKTICVKVGETVADIDWFINLAKPKPGCSSKILSQSQSQIKVEFSCPMNGQTLKGPSTIEMSSDRISITSDLELDLPYAPLPMGQRKTAFHVSTQCHAN